MRRCGDSWGHVCLGMLEKSAVVPSLARAWVRSGRLWVFGGVSVLTGCQDYETCTDTATCHYPDGSLEVVPNANLGEGGLSSRPVSDTESTAASDLRPSTEMPAASTSSLTGSPSDTTQGDDPVGAPTDAGFSQGTNTGNSAALSDGSEVRSGTDLTASTDNSSDAPELACTESGTRPCSEAKLVGNCASGTQTCAGGNWGECSVTALSQDSCGAGDDANCNGIANEGCGCVEGSERPCSEAGLYGACAEGTQTCREDGSWGSCSIAPAVSDDCSITSDDSTCDGVPNGGCACVSDDQVTCGPERIGICASGISSCVNGEYSACVGAVYAKARDCRSSLDNDCDGSTDNTVDSVCQCVPGTTEACNTHPGKDGTGICKAGVRTCQASADGSSSHWTTCTGDVGPAGADSCVTAGDDSNCNGQLNDGCVCLSSQTTSCSAEYSSKGVCGSKTLTCSVSGKWPSKATCDAIATTESCSGSLDEDCDGNVNEVDACPCAAAPCQHNGLCSASGASYTCQCSGTGYTGTNCELPIALSLGLPTGVSSCHAVDISADGTVVAATCVVPAGSKPYYWTATTGWKSLALAVNFARGAELKGMSSNGQIFAGIGFDNSNNPSAVRWSSQSATGSALPSGSNCLVNDLSSDGTTIVGESATNGTLYAWTGSSAPTTVTPNSSMADAKLSTVSGNGAVKWGASSGNGLVKWTSSTSSTTVAFADYSLQVSAANQDGTVIVGSGYLLPFGWARAWIYSGGQLTWLDSISSGGDCAVWGVSNDGKRVAGMCQNAPAVWLDGTLTPIEDYLYQNNATIDNLSQYVQAITSDGKVAALGDGSGGDVVIVRLP